jgi:hypothetical protein
VPNHTNFYYRSVLCAKWQSVRYLKVTQALGSALPRRLFFAHPNKGPVLAMLATVWFIMIPGQTFAEELR